MDKFTVRGIKNETFTILAVESMDALPASKAALINSGKEPVKYVMARVIEGTRKKPYTVYAYRFVNSGEFISAF